MGVSPHADLLLDKYSVGCRLCAREIQRLGRRLRKLPWRPMVSLLLIGTLSLATTFAAESPSGASSPADEKPVNADAKASRNPRPAPQAQGLGSLATAGDVFANGTRIPGQVTVFGGDDIRVGEGMATLTAAGQRGSLAIFPQSEVVFSTNPRFTAELRVGRVGVRSSNMPGGLILRTGNFVIVGSVQGQESAATADRMNDGSFLIACDEGGIGVLPLGGGNGLFLRAGQSAEITAAGVLVAQNEGQPQTTTAGTNTPPPNLKKRSYAWLWILLGAGGGGAALATIIVVTHKRRVVTPDSPS